MASATLTATSSSAPCVIAMSQRRSGRDGDDPPPASSDRSPAAIGSHGLLSRSISTSSIWLIPAMKTFTQGPPASVHSRSATPEARSSDAAMTYEPDDRQRRPDQRVGPAEAPQDAAAPTPPLAGTPVSPRPGGDSSRERYRASGDMPPMLAAYRANRRRPALRRSARLPRRRHGGPLLAHHQPRQARSRSSSSPSAASRRAAVAMASLAAHPAGKSGRRRGHRLARAWAARGGRALRAAAARRRDLRRDEARYERRPADRSPTTPAWRSPSPSRAPWPRRAFGALGPAHVVPGLSQYWHLGCCAHGRRRRAHGRRQTIDLDGAVAYAEKNWGAGGMPPAWWWGQAHGFDRPDVCVAFAGGSRRARAAGHTATALVVAVGGEVRTVVRPLQRRCASPSTAAPGAWPAAASRSRATPTAPPHTCCRCPSRTSAGAWTTGRPSTSPGPAPERAPPQAHALRGTSDLAGLERGRGASAHSRASGISCTAQPFPSGSLKNTNRPHGSPGPRRPRCRRPAGGHGRRRRRRRRAAGPAPSPARSP